MAGVLTALLLAAGAALLTLHPPRARPAPSPSRQASERRGIDDAPLLLDLMAAMLDAGSSVEGALAAVAAVADVGVAPSLARAHQARLLGATWDDAWDMALMHPVKPDGGPPRAGRGSGRGSGRGAGRSAERTVVAVRRGLRFAVATGAPSAELLRAHALQIRRRRTREGERRAAALGVHLVLPLGLCSLPAFICLGVVPVVLGLLPTL